jgi:hypothetical protein
VYGASPRDLQADAQIVDRDAPYCRLLGEKLHNLSWKKAIAHQKSDRFFYIKAGRNPFPISAHELTN